MPSSARAANATASPKASAANRFMCVPFRPGSGECPRVRGRVLPERAPPVKPLRGGNGGEQIAQFAELRSGFRIGQPLCREVTLRTQESVQLRVPAVEGGRGGDRPHEPCPDRR